MARYIDADKIDFSPLKNDFDRARAKVIIIGQPTADVVPKSEVEKLVQDVTRLEQEKDALIKNYAECMKDYAMEIFEEIEEVISCNLCLDINAYSAYAELKKKYIEGD